jgi:sucrose-6-phosphate hydrolase SacC (GH32 family)
MREVLKQMKFMDCNAAAQSLNRLVCVLAGLAWVANGQCETASTSNRQDMMIEDFEGTNYGDWKVTGDAFGAAPAHGTLPHQMAVDGFLGDGFASSYHGGDGSIGTLTSPSFKVARKYIHFLIGGGGFAGKTCMNLLCDGKVVRTATGLNTQPGGSEHLDWQGWDVQALEGKSVVLEIVDQATGGWGHISIDQIVQTDRHLAGMIQNDVELPLKVAQRYFNLPVKNGATKRTLRLMVDGKNEREFQIELADAKPDWWAFMDVSAFHGRAVVLQADILPEDSLGLKQIEQADVIKDGQNIYHEALRPQFHFSPRRGWNNDPNGMVFYQGEYQLFFQHNPYGWNWDNMHWGHAASRDLVHWTERPEALYPDALGMIYSGSAVVDWHNTSGFGRNGQPPIVLIYTAAGDQFSQCLAYSTDGGKTFTKYAGNPVVPQITGGNRDPKVFWHEPSKHWVMVLWVEKDKRNTIHFLTSANLKDWKVASESDDFFECPDFFELPVDGNPANKKWVLTAASSEYKLGTFDGEKFIAETPKLPGVRSDAFYAAQTYSDIPASDGRRIQIGWLRAPSPGMPFNQCMTVPLELKLMTTPEGVRLARLPVAELAKLRSGTKELGIFSLNAGDPNPLAKVSGERLELRAEFEPGAAGEVDFNLRGLSVSYDAAHQELIVNGHRAPAPLRGGRQRLIVYVDRTASEVFASDGLTYVPLPFLPKAADQNLSVQVKGGSAKFDALKIYQLKSIWK